MGQVSIALVVGCNKLLPAYHGKTCPDRGTSAFIVQ